MLKKPPEITTLVKGPKNGDIQQEWDDLLALHRLINTRTGAATPWAGYTGFCYLDGMVGCTAYFLQKEAVLTPDEFCRQVGTTINHDPL